MTASATYTRPLGDLGAEWFLRGDYVYNSKTWLEAENEAYIGDLNLMNARLGVESDSWTAAVYVDNFLDDETPLLATEFPNFGAVSSGDQRLPRGPATRAQRRHHADPPLLTEERP